MNVYVSLLALTLATSALAAPQGDWDHNGSHMVVSPPQGTISYDVPKAAIRSVVEPGAILFRGAFKPDGTVEGTAYAFKQGCPAAPYAVRGRFSDTNVTLRGPGPVRSGCAITGYSERSPHALLLFTKLERPQGERVQEIWEQPHWIAVTHKVVNGVDYTTRLHVSPPGPVRADGSYDSNRISVECEVHDPRTGKSTIVRGKGGALARQGTLGGDAGKVGTLGINVPGDDPKYPNGYVEFYENQHCASGVPDFGIDD